MLTNDFFPELRADGSIFGSADYFDEKRKYTVFSLCKSSSGSSFDCDTMLEGLRRLVMTQIDSIESDFKKAKASVFLISSSSRKDMENFVRAIENALAVINARGSFSASNLTMYLSEYSSPYKSDSPGRKKPEGSNGQELCSREYMQRITSMIFGPARISLNSTSNMLSDAIIQDINSIINSIYADLQKALQTICRVSESNKKGMIDAVETLRRITSSNRGRDIINTLEYNGEITFPFPPKKPFVFSSKELLRGHQPIEDFLKGHSNMSILPNEPFEVDSVEKYCHDISKYAKAALELDNRNKQVYIVLYINDDEVFRAEYKDSSYQSYMSRFNTWKGLSESGLVCRLLTEKDIVAINRENWNSIIEEVGSFIEQAGYALASLDPLWGHAQLAGQATQATSHTFDFSNKKVQPGDFEFRYGHYSKGYGGIFDGRTLQRKA